VVAFERFTGTSASTHTKVWLRALKLEASFSFNTLLSLGVIGWLTQSVYMNVIH